MSYSYPNHPPETTTLPYHPGPKPPGQDHIRHGDPGQHPGQYPGQYPGQHPGQHPGQQPGQHPGQHPGQYPGQHPGQHSGQHHSPYPPEYDPTKPPAHSPRPPHGQPHQYPPGSHSPYPTGQEHHTPQPGYPPGSHSPRPPTNDPPHHIPPPAYPTGSHSPYPPTNDPPHHIPAPGYPTGSHSPHPPTNDPPHHIPPPGYPTGSHSPYPPTGPGHHTPQACPPPSHSPCPPVTVDHPPYNPPTHPVPPPSQSPCPPGRVDYPPYNSPPQPCPPPSHSPCPPDTVNHPPYNPSTYPCPPPSHSPHPPPQTNYPGPCDPTPQICHPSQSPHPQGPGHNPAYPRCRPTCGYEDIPIAGDAPHEAEALRNAMKGFGTNRATLIKILAPADAILMARIRFTYKRFFNRDLDRDIIKETSGNFETTLLALVRGPLQNDVQNVRSAVKGAGTNEILLDDVLLGRTNADMDAIKREYRRLYDRSLVDDVKGDLSMKTEHLYDLVLCAARDEETPLDPNRVDTDTYTLYDALQSKSAKSRSKQDTVCEIFAKRSDGFLRAVALKYERTYHRSLEDVVKKEFSGHMEHALLHILRGAMDRAMRDAVLLEDCMKGLGTRDALLIQRVVRYHWDHDHMRQVRAAYKVRYAKELTLRIASDTSGDYERLLVACVSV